MPTGNVMEDVVSSTANSNTGAVTGTVKWFNNAKGYGFIVADNSEEDMFAHYSAITMDGYKTLKAGQSVVFDIKKVENGIHAINISASTEVDRIESE